MQNNKVMEKKAIQPDWTKVSEVELVYRLKVKAVNRPQIKSSKDAHALLVTIWNPGTIELREEFKVLFLNRANRALGIYELSIGGVTGTVADPRLLFAAAVKANASSLMIAHNHPSGNLKPSQADEDLTQKMAGGAKLLDMKLLDHLIMTADGYFSFADEGLL
jgi:DNA repair protein RadC